MTDAPSNIQSFLHQELICIHINIQQEKESRSLIQERKLFIKPLMTINRAINSEIIILR